MIQALMYEFEDCRFRRARLEDLGPISRLEKRVWLALAASQAELQRRFFFFPQAFQVAVARHSQMAGFCSGLLTPQDALEVDLRETFPPQHVPRSRFFFLLGLTVTPLFRRKGVASQLVEREIRVAARYRCRKVQLIANDLSRPLFERKGFLVIRDLPHLFRGYPDLMRAPVLMELEL